MSRYIADDVRAVHVENVPGLESVTIAVTFPLGSRDGAVDGSGIPHLLEHLLLSSPVGGHRSLSYYVESLGGQASAFTGKEMLVVMVRVLQEDAVEIASLLRIALTEPEFTEEVFQAERNVVLEELAEAAADPSDCVQDVFFEHLFPDHPLGQPVGGTAERVAEVRLVDVERWWGANARAVTPDVVVIGADVPDEVRTALTFPVRLRPRGEVTAPAKPPRPSYGSKKEKDHGFAWVMAGCRGPRWADDRRFAMEVLAHAFGESPSSVLFDRLRRRLGLVYFLHTWYTPYRDSGIWRSRIGVRSSNVDQVLQEVRICLAEAAAGELSEDSLESARKQATAALVLERENPVERAHQVARLRLGVEGSEWDWRREVEALAKVTADDVAEAAREVSEELNWVVRLTGEAEDE